MRITTTLWMAAVLLGCPAGLPAQSFSAQANSPRQIQLGLKLYY